MNRGAQNANIARLSYYGIYGTGGTFDTPTQRATNIYINRASCTTSWLAPARQ